MSTTTSTWLLCLCCLVCLAALASGNSGAAKPTTAKDAAAHIYKIKRQDKYQRQTTGLDIASAFGLQTAGKMPNAKPTTRQKNLTKGAHGLNKRLLNKMGFIKVKAPNSHNRKRLAVESRRHASRDDSHMFIIKLPPNLNYYTGPSSAKNAAAIPAKAKASVAASVAAQPVDNAAKAATMPTASTTEASASASVDASKSNGKKVSFPFSSNGRPGRIYHWNLPVLKHALHKKPHFAHVSAADRNRLLDIKDIPTWRKPWENETVEKSFAAGGGKSKYKKSLKPKSPTYYAPAQAVKKQSFNKYFAGNGKPKGFYVIKEHQTKPLFYQNIIS